MFTVDHNHIRVLDCSIRRLKLRIIIIIIIIIVIVSLLTRLARKPTGTRTL